MYSGDDKSLARPDWKKNNWKVAIFRPTRRSLLSAETWLDGQTSDFFFEWLTKVRVWSLWLVSFLVGIRTYQHPGNSSSCLYMALMCRSRCAPGFRKNKFRTLRKIDHGRQYLGNWEQKKQDACLPFQELGVFFFPPKGSCYNFNMTILPFRGPCIVVRSYNESQRDALFLKFIW